jgi:hypothetical protein
MERAIVVFNHIPKTAGTTLRFILTQNYSPDETLFVDNYWDQPAMRRAIEDNERRRQLKLVYGHHAYAFAQVYKGPVNLITFLREPFSRLVSHYHYAQRVEEDKNHKYSSLSLEDFARATQMDDYQARQLVFPMSKDLIPKTLEMRGTLFKIAMDHLRERVSFSGIVEHFDESVVMLRDHLKWPKLPIYAPLMVNDKMWCNEHSETTRNRMLEVYLPVSRMLYDYALQRHENRWSAEGERYSRELEDLRKQSRIVGSLLDQRDLMQSQLWEARARKLGGVYAGLA